MITNDDFIKEERGNRTKCIGLKIKMKRDCVIDCKSQDRKLVHTLSALNVEYIFCEIITENENEAPKKFKLKADEDAVTIAIKVGNLTHKANVKMIQFGLNSNKATTGHKLQGVSLNRMVVRSQDYDTENWIYVVLSRVRTLAGLFICEKLNDTKNIVVIIYEYRKRSNLEQKRKS